MDTEPLGDITTKIIGDDWTYTFAFKDAAGVLVDMSGSTWAAKLITESPPYIVADITGDNGSVDVSQVASGIITVTVSDALTSTLIQDLDSVDMPSSDLTSFNTRLVLTGTAGIITTTWAIMPIRVVRR